MTPPIEVRVRVLDTWEEHSLRLSAASLVTDLKREAMARSRIRGAVEDYEVKCGGALLEEGNRTLGDSGIESGTALIVLSRRRRPAK